MRSSNALRAATIAVAAIAFALALAWVGWSLWTPPTGRADPADARQVAVGLRVYRDHCASCHGAQLEGQPDWKTRMANGRLPAPPHDETGHTWRHPDEVLFRITKTGLRPPVAPEGYESDMPAFADVLSDAEIWAVLSYIKSTWPPAIRARHNRLNEESKP